MVFISPYKMTFKYAFLAILPQAGPIASRLVMGCALDVLGISPEEVRPFRRVLHPSTSNTY